MRQLIPALVALFFLAGDARAQLWFPSASGLYVEVGDQGFRIMESDFTSDRWGLKPPGEVRAALLHSRSRTAVANGDHLQSLGPGALILAPANARPFLTGTGQYWEGRLNAHFHDYACQATDVPTTDLPVNQWMNDGDSLRIEGLPVTIRAIATPGPQPDGMSYLLVHDNSGERWLFSGELLFDDGRIDALYLFQDAIPEAGLRGYHGYAGRLAGLLESVRLLSSIPSDRHFSSRGELDSSMGDPLDTVAKRVLGLYRNYLSSSALHWYFGDRFLKGSFGRLGGSDPEPAAPNFTRFEDRPAWVLSMGTSRIIQSGSGRVFLLDCGNYRVTDFIDKLMEAGTINGVDGIFVTHYHDDHTDHVNAASLRYDCDVYCLREYAGVLADPAAYRLPCLTANPIERLRVVEDGYRMEWEEFVFTFHFFPGQTWYHGALLAHLRDDPEQAVLFAGDAFTPSGLDDYCTWNRNLLNPDATTPDASGYFQCLSLILNYNRNIPGYPGLPLMVANQHVDPVFEIGEDRIVGLMEKLGDRVAMLSSLTASHVPALGLDPYWFTLHPYIQESQPGAEFTIRPVIQSSSLPDGSRKATVRLHFPQSFGISPVEFELSRDGDSLSAKPMKWQVPPTVPDGVYPVTASIALEGPSPLRSLHHAEALVHIRH
jgi:glyoxylase-like metal-dependent hydrolase (beta-lactamase superfamily II)